MTQSQKYLVIMVLIFWTMGMIVVARSYESLTLAKLPSFNATVDQDGIKIMALGEKYQISLEDQDKSRSLLKKYEQVLNAFNGYREMMK